MRVLHVHSGNLYGGIERMLVAIANHSDHHFALCFHGRLEDELKQITPHVYHLGSVQLRNPLTVINARRKLKALGSYDHVICHGTWSESVFGGHLWLHAPLSTHYLDRLAMMRKPFVICNSKFTQASLPAHIKSEVIYCPVDLPEVTPQRSGRPIIIMVARMEEGKGHNILLAALKELNDLDYECWIVGGAQRDSERVYLDDLRRMANSRVKFLGEQRDVHSLLARAHVYCQPSTTPEGFGLTFIEALNAGLPVITSDCGGAREIIDESCGTLTTPAPSSVAQALRYWLSRKDAGDTRARARALTDPEKQMAQLNRLLESIGLSQSMHFRYKTL